MFSEYRLKRQTGGPTEHSPTLADASMTHHPFYQVDAFVTDAPLSGGPAAVMLFDAFPDAALMQAVAAENNLAETAFLVRKADSMWDLRWFTPTIEVPLCGHATLASAHVVFEHVGWSGDVVHFDTASGRLDVQRLADGRLEMDFPARPPQRIATPEGLVEALGAEPAEVWAAQFVLAVFETPDQVRALSPDVERLKPVASGATQGRGNVVCAAPGAREGYDVVSRFFAPGSGIAEDPATGSAHCILAPFFSGLLGREELSCFQAYPGRGAHITTRVQEDRVRLIGRARTVIEGNFFL